MRNTRKAKHEQRKRKIWQILLLSTIFLFGAGFWLFFGNIANETNASEPNNTEIVSTEHAKRMEYKGFKEVVVEESNKEDTNKVVPPIIEKDYIDVPEEMLKPTHEQEVTKNNIAYLTFDDGPMPLTMDILNLLDKYNAKATFFMIEPYIKTYPEIVHEMVNRGHQVGLHSVTHDVKRIYASSQSVVKEMEQTLLTLEDITGIRSYIMRVPYGSVPHMKPDYIDAVNEYGFQMWDWNIDSQDWKLTDGSYINHTINQIQAFESGEPMVILLHDRQTTLDHLEKLLVYLSDQGFDMKRLEPDLQPVQFAHN